MCNVRPEDSGEIKFVARHVDSAAYLDVEGMLSILSRFKCSALLVIYQFYAVLLHFVFILKLVLP